MGVQSPGVPAPGGAKHGGFQLLGKRGLLWEQRARGAAVTRGEESPGSEGRVFRELGWAGGAGLSEGSSGVRTFPELHLASRFGCPE